MSNSLNTTTAVELLKAYRNSKARTRRARANLLSLNPAFDKQDRDHQLHQENSWGFL